MSPRDRVSALSEVLERFEKGRACFAEVCTPQSTSQHFMTMNDMTIFFSIVKKCNTF